MEGLRTPGLSTEKTGNAAGGTRPTGFEPLTHCQFRPVRPSDQPPVCLYALADAVSKDSVLALWKGEPAWDAEAVAALKERSRQKLTGEASDGRHVCGERMPQGGEPIPAQHAESIRAWIEAGAVLD